MFVPGYGAKPSRIAIVGEAPGEEEAAAGVPFVGSSGRLLRFSTKYQKSLLAQAGIDHLDCYFTNVFKIRPPGNDLTHWLTTKTKLPAGYTWPAFRGAKFIIPEMTHYVDELKTELEEVDPTVIIALGGTATWALQRNPLISKMRGTVGLSTLLPGVKVVSTWHPAAILRQWSLKEVAISDLTKAENESHSKEVFIPKGEIWINPTIQDLETFYTAFLQNAEIISIDIETEAKQVTCIGFSAKDKCLVLPFWDKTKSGWNYWSESEEVVATKFMRKVLENDRPKVFQNGLYDLTFLLFSGHTVNNAAHDTMLLHHSLQPEMLKSLGFLASLYTDWPAWKHLRDVSHSKHATEKADE